MRTGLKSLIQASDHRRGRMFFWISFGQLKILIQRAMVVLSADPSKMERIFYAPTQPVLNGVANAKTAVKVTTWKGECSWPIFCLF